MEVNPRLAGGFIPELVRLATGLDLIGETVAAAAGRGTRLARETRQAASIRFLLAPGEGRLVTVEGLKEAAASEGVLDVRLYPEPGAAVFRRGDFRDRVGHVIACGRTPDESGWTAEAARDRLRAVLESP
jgi:biotin carboxylase